MTIAIVLALAALVASVYLLLGKTSRPWTFAAVAASALQMVIAFGWAGMRLGGISLHAILSIVLAGCGAVIYSRVGRKAQVTAATVIAFVGVVGLLIIIGR
jgi:hypothetical protein